MNTAIPHSAFRNSAHRTFAPIRRADSDAHTLDSGAPRSFASRAAEDFFGEIWPHGLLDRLHEPLSRIRE